MKKINLEEIIEEKYPKKYHDNYYYHQFSINHVKILMHEACEKVLELAAENAECKLRNKIECSNSQLENGFVIGNNAIIINKQSILDTIKQVK